jgi:hypothetical protein
MEQRGKHLSRKERREFQVQYWSTQQCGFCSSLAGSEEHVWPKWLLNRAKRTKETTFRLSDGNDVPLNEWRGAGAEIVTYALCAECNSLMGRNVEQVVSSILLAMAIDGEPAQINSVNGLSIMTWMLLKAMTFDLFEDSGARIYTQSERDTFRRFVEGDISASLPPVLNCFIGVCVPMDEVHTYMCPGLGSGIGEPANGDHRQTVRFNTFTFAFATLVLQVVTASAPAKNDTTPAGGVLTRLGDFAWNPFIGTVSEIFPGPTGSTTSWPGGQVLGDPPLSLEDFAKRWGTEVD